MNLTELKEYLSIVVDLEKDLFMQSECVKQMRDQAYGLNDQIPKETEKPVYEQRTGNTSCMLDICLAISGIIALIGLVFLLGASTKGFLFIIPFIVILIINILRQKMADKEAEQIARYEYDHALIAYEEDNKNRSHIIADIERRKRVILAEADVMEAKYCETKNTLSQIYSYDVIFPKYRNFVMVCSLYEYLSAGRCTSLEGHEGAYNILEMEVRLDRIIVQLDRVIAKLNAIENNQYMLYSAVKESQQQIDNLLNATLNLSYDIHNIDRRLQQSNESLNAMQKDSAVMSYTAKQIQKELHYMNRMNYLTGKNDGPFWNAPPN